MKIRKEYTLEITKEEQKAFVIVSRILCELADEASCFDDFQSANEIIESVRLKHPSITLSGYFERVNFEYVD